MNLLNPNYTRASLKLALPVMITQLGQVSVNVFDNLIVGKLLGAQALASVSLGNAVFLSFFVFTMGFSYAIPPLVAEAHSRLDHHKINSIFRHGFVINLAVGLLMLLLLFLGLPLLYHLDQPKEIIPDAIQFLTVMAFSMIPFTIFQTLREVAEGLSFTIGITKATIIANILNIVLNYIFIEGKLGFSEMGIHGAALATLIARIFMVSFLYIVLCRDPRTSRYIRAFHLRITAFSTKMFCTLFNIGFPTSLQLFFEVSAFTGAAFICGLVGSTDIAAHQIALSMVSLTFNLCIGFSVASTVMVGRKLGEKDFVGLRNVGINNLKIVFIFMLICGSIFIIARNILPSFFFNKNDFNLVYLTSKLLIIAALFQLSDGIQVTCLGCLRGIQDAKIPSIITFVAYWGITIPLGYFLCYTMNIGAFGMWIALGIGLTISAIFLVIRFLRLTKKFN
ncbi:MATE family efflux transporter [Elizabethkingia anophelis]|uniref:MATE family efflux transporter n=1 Tax=Elizabethkingia anophelis TaxID=1117645 RepID=UPI00136E6D76|nr:MATE family efflux transporter [Elizabethkingia anophelis]MYY27368.1 MATE family efflux transporter [Elizabethkingia anophelis]